VIDIVPRVLGGKPAMYIAGSWVTTDETRSVINPADESVIAEAPQAQADHAEQALEAAQRAQRNWGRKSGVERGATLRAIAEGIRARQDELAQLIVAEQGKTITEARGEVGDAAAGFFDYYAGYERAQVGSMFAPDKTNEQLFIKSVPYGVVVGIIPWNYPAALFARKVAPAIMAGNAIVVKPHEDTPLSALALARIIEEAGVPPSIVNVVTGAGRVVGDALVHHPVTQMVTVTGSVRGVREILAAAENIVPVSLELGGKAPFVVLDDADVASAVENAVDARFWNCGQVCTCNERTYVQRGVYEEFVERFVDAASSLRRGIPCETTCRWAEGQRARADQGRGLRHGRSTAGSQG
jgi:lactaldehyde dehydrogenase / glycolaldehyde dehydrogenase